MEIKLLVNNTAPRGLQSEHGFAVWIESAEQVVLFDCGQSGAIFHNAEQLGCDLARVDKLVLSHGHYDHTGALAPLMAMNAKAAIYCHPDAFASRNSLHSGRAPHSIGMPISAVETLEHLPSERLFVSTKPQSLASGVVVTGQIPRLHPLEDTGGPFFFDCDGKHVDPISDDQAIWLKTEKGLLVVLGCCHSGLMNTLKYIQEVSGQARIFGIIGGLHLLCASDLRLEQTVDVLAQLKLELLVHCHCTGDRAAAILKHRLGDCVQEGSVGMAWAF